MINEIYSTIKKTENCKLLSSSEMPTGWALRKYTYVIQINTEISLNKGLMEIVLYLAFPLDLSTQLPKIFIEEKSFEEIKYLPHINSDLSICVFDETINLFFDESALPEIVENMIYRAKQIISLVDDEKNMAIEFDNEFKAYWEISYNNNDKVGEKGFFLVDGIDNPLKCLKFNTPISNYQYLIYNECELFNKFNSFLKLKNIGYKEINVFEIKFNKNIPPFSLTFNESIKFLDEFDCRAFKKSVNKNGISSVIVVFKKPKFDEYYGWIYNNFIPNPSIIKQRKNKSNWELLTDITYKNSFVERLIFNNISPSRLQKRTSGFAIQKQKAATVIGIGSVGSNLLNLLSKLPFNKFHLVDPDILKIENIYRHQYGFDCINSSKAEIAQNILLNKNPFYEIKVFKNSIINVLNEIETFLNISDINLIAIGSTLIEKYILEQAIKNKCNKPLIIFWVEPFLASGQMIYINPHDYSEALKLILNFPYHVLATDEDKSNIYYKEGSCQSGYYPYSETYLMMFLSAIYGHLFQIIQNDSPETEPSAIYTWIGDKLLLESKELKMTDFAEYKDSFQLLINKI
jgi:hypothetical protein